jgi:hypothetical protein
MAIWQFDFWLLPKSGILSRFPTIPTALSQDEFNDMEAWHGRQPPTGYESTLSEMQPRIQSWHERLGWWGSEEGNRIDVWTESNLVASVNFRIDIAVLDIAFVQGMIHLARAWDCFLMSGSGGALIKPTRGAVLRHLIESTGANEAWDWLRGTYIDRDLAAERVFLCHSSIDRTFTDRLAKALRDDDVPVWYDQWELEVGDSLTGRIEEGITGSAWVAIILSPTSVMSPWVRRELTASLALELASRDISLLPILLQDCDMPLFLWDKVYADFRSDFDAGLRSVLRRVRDKEVGTRSNSR